MKERRKFTRVEGTIPLKLSDSEFDVVTKTKNISGSGVYCSVDTPLEPMTKLKIVLLIPYRVKKGKRVKKINCNGVVVRKGIFGNTNDEYYDLQGTRLASQVNRLNAAAAILAARAMAVSPKRYGQSLPGIAHLPTAWRW